MEPVELYDIGAEIFDAFEDLGNSNQVIGRHHLASEAQRFRLWAHSLGLHQQGHASLDYRVRDAVVVKDRLAEILSELQEHLVNLLAIAKGERLPYEQDVSAEANKDDEDDDKASDISDAECHDSEQSNSDSESSVHEVDFRLQSLTESLDALYSLATKIRNPRNRPQRTNNQLYKRIPAEHRASFIEEREQAEIATIAWIQRNQIIDGISSLEPVGIEGLIEQYASRSNWLVRRTGIANARRKQQFVYWKDHATRLSKAPIRKKPVIQIVEQPTEGIGDEPITIPQSQLAASVVTEQAPLVMAPSLATSATKLEADFVKLDDLKSVISHQSYVSTVINVKGEKVEWPAPPTHITSNGYFTCPYCKILCPQRYLVKNAWHVHLIHDLQPYHCTYKDCPDPHRLYGTRQEWLDHESQHTRVWHCQGHGEEFETQPEYVEHLKTSHPETTPEHFSPELIATVVGPSLKPYRDCPFCPTAFSDTVEMQKHITFHLERLALIALTPLAGGGSDEDSSGRPSDSHEVQHHGRQGSILGDFDDVEKCMFKEVEYPNLDSRSLFRLSEMERSRSRSRPPGTDPAVMTGFENSTTYEDSDEDIDIDRNDEFVRQLQERREERRLRRIKSGAGSKRTAIEREKDSDREDVLPYYEHDEADPARRMRRKVGGGASTLHESYGHVQILDKRNLSQLPSFVDNDASSQIKVGAWLETSWEPPDAAEDNPPTDAPPRDVNEVYDQPIRAERPNTTGGVERDDGQRGRRHTRGKEQRRRNLEPSRDALYGSSMLTWEGPDAVIHERSGTRTNENAMRMAQMEAAGPADFVSPGLSGLPPDKNIGLPPPSPDESHMLGLHLATESPKADEEYEGDEEDETNEEARRPQADKLPDREKTTSRRSSTHLEGIYDSPRVPGPEPPNPRNVQMADTFAEDPAFTANIAAALQGNSFDPNIIIDNASFHQRDLPLSSNETDVYHSPIVESVIDLGSTARQVGQALSPSPPPPPPPLPPPSFLPSPPSYVGAEENAKELSTRRRFSFQNVFRRQQADGMQDQAVSPSSSSPTPPLPPLHEEEEEDTKEPSTRRQFSPSVRQRRTIADPALQTHVDVDVNDNIPPNTAADNVPRYIDVEGKRYFGPLSSTMDPTHSPEIVTSDGPSSSTRPHLQPNNPDRRRETSSERVSTASPLVTDVGNRSRVSKALTGIGNYFSTASRNRFDDSEFKHGKALDFPKIPGEDHRNPSLARIRAAHLSENPAEERRNSDLLYNREGYHDELKNPHNSPSAAGSRDKASPRSSINGSMLGSPTVANLSQPTQSGSDPKPSGRSVLNSEFEPPNQSGYDSDQYDRQQAGRGNVLQKNQRYVDVYDEEEHGRRNDIGSSGAAKRVLDYFRRRGGGRDGKP